MTDTSNALHTIKQIIFWLRQIDDYNKIIGFISRNYDLTGKILEKPKTKTLVARITSRVGCCKEVELSDEVLTRLYTDFKEYVNHLESLVIESDPQLVEVAKAIYYGEITPKGFEFK